MPILPACLFVAKRHRNSASCEVAGQSPANSSWPEGTPEPSAPFARPSGAKHFVRVRRPLARLADFRPPYGLTKPRRTPRNVFCRASKGLPHAKFHVRPILLLAAAFVAGTAASARSQEISGTTNETAAFEEFRADGEKDLRWHIELKRQFTNRGSIEESSKTTLRLEATPDGFLSRIRVDIPFVDEKNGDPLTPQLGDLKLRFGFHWLSAGEIRLEPFIETTFPTADPESVGGGKYQLSPGAELFVPIRTFGGEGESTWKLGTKTLVQQVVSVAGDKTRNDINYTRFEPELLTAWERKLVLSVTPKLVFDWHQGGKTGIMLELEGDWNFSRRWRVALTLGKGLLNTDVPTGYQSKLELSLRFNF